MNVPVLLNFLNDVPLPLTSLLVQLTPYVSFIRRVADLLTWSPPVHHSYLLLVFWCFFCLLADPAIRYFLPILVFLVLSIQRFSPSNPTLVNELVLQSTISDLQYIFSLLPTLPSLPDKYTSARVLLLLYIPYIILTQCVRLRILIAVVGSIFLTYRAPWAIALRRILWRSAYVRWTVYYLWSQLTGRTLSFNVSHLDVSVPSDTNLRTLRFLFTVYENQRWWMGLDWTAALLPGERPSWCSASQHPVSPPNAFSLPRTSTVVVSDGKGKKVKCTAVWKWEEPEWRVVVRRLDGGVNRVERPLPSVEKEAGNRSLKGKRQDSVDQNSVTASGSTQDENLADVGSVAPHDSATDPDGWVYGDNKWENLSSKGGMSKYTRFRRWTRIASVHEVVDIDRDLEADDIQSESVVSLNSTGPHIAEDVTNDHPRMETSPLRQRLINALKQPSTCIHDD